MPKKKEEKPVVEEKFQQVDVNAKDPRTVVLMLDSPEQSIVCRACQALQKHMEKSDQNCTELQGLGVVQRLVTLLNSQDKVVCACGIVCLAVMIPHLSVRRMLLKLNCIPSLVNMLKLDEELFVVERASYVVSHLAEEYTFKQQLVEQGVCQLLLSLVSHPDCDVIKNSSKALSLLTSHHKAKTIIAEENGFPVLLTLLDSEYAEIQEQSLKSLEHCLNDGSCRTVFSEAGGLAKITEFLNNKEWDDLHVLAIDVLALCLVEDKGMEALHSSDCLQRLLESIKESQVPQMKTKATTALARSARDSVSQKILHEQQAEKVFIELLTTQEDTVCIAACEALGSLSSLSSSRQYIGREGGIASLVALLQHDNVKVRSAAVCTLASVIKETIANCNLVSEAGGIEPLVALLSDEDASCRVFAAECMITMSPSGSLRSELVEHGGISGLAGCLSHTDTRVVSTSTQAIALLAVDSKTREQFPAESVSTLLALLLSSHTEICRNTAWALAVLAQDRKITETAFKSKSVDTIQRLSKESSHRDIKEFAGLALKRLLSGSPAAKYCLTGTLSPQDVLVGIEFWDMGMAEAKRGFIPLEDIVNQQARFNRPVLTVSLVNHPPPPTPPVSSAGEEETGKDESEVPTTTRTKSRQAQQGSGGNTTTKSTKKKQPETRQPDEDGGVVQQLPVQEGLLSPDPYIWEHIVYIQTHIQPLKSIKEQVERLAIYVSQSMGGAVGRSTNIQFELPLAETQASNHTVLIPLGEIKKGSFQHRALLYKVLADQLGLPCSLQRGQYGRHWNTVILGHEEWLVDLMYTPSKLFILGSKEAIDYQTV